MSKQIVYTPGVFDLFHIGHLNILRRARLTGDYLVVGVCCDRLVKQTKGAPVINEINRAEIIRELRCVDEVHIYQSLDQTEVLKMLNVDIFVVGEEFGGRYANGKVVPEHLTALNYCQENDIKVIRVNRMPGISTSELKNQK